MSERDDAAGGEATPDRPEVEGSGPAQEGGEDGGSAAVGLPVARRKAIEGVRELLDHEVDGVVSVERTDEGWRALVEVVERSAVPDTQDIIGRYEVDLDDAGTLVGYGLRERFRRGDMKEEL